MDLDVDGDVEFEVSLCLQSKDRQVQGEELLGEEIPHVLPEQVRVLSCILVPVNVKTVFRLFARRAGAKNGISDHQE